MEGPESYYEQQLGKLDQAIEEQRVQKHDNILAKFKDGRDRYMNDAMFRQCVDALIHGADPINVLDTVLLIFITFAIKRIE